MSAATARDIDKRLLVFEEIVPARGRIAFEMFAGQVCRIVDLEGKQVADFICFDLHDHEDKLSVNNTGLMNRTIFITTGHALYSTRATKLMTIIDDTCGVHDLIAGSCSEGTNRVRYGVRGTPNCRSNFELALEPHSIPLREIPYSFNVFMNVPVTEEKTEIIEPVSKAGDHIDLKAERDLLVAVSNCPQERNPCNGFNPTPIQVSVYELEPTGKEL
jgi:urea carboxylase-associated protein 1